MYLSVSILNTNKDRNSKKRGEKLVYLQNGCERKLILAVRVYALECSCSDHRTILYRCPPNIWSTFSRVEKKILQVMCSHQCETMRKIEKKKRKKRKRKNRIAILIHVEHDDNEMINLMNEIWKLNETFIFPLVHRDFDCYLRNF